MFSSPNSEFVQTQHHWAQTVMSELGRWIEIRFFSWGEDGPKNWRIIYWAIKDPVIRLLQTILFRIFLVLNEGWVELLGKHLILKLFFILTPILASSPCATQLYWTPNKFYGVLCAMQAWILFTQQVCWNNINLTI